jgi:hypothetical protein
VAAVPTGTFRWCDVIGVRCAPEFRIQVLQFFDVRLAHSATILRSSAPGISTVS